MSGVAGFVGPFFNSVNGTVTMSAWVVGLGLLLVALSVVLAVVRAGLPAALAIAAVLVVTGGSTLIWLDHQRATERRAFESRFAELQARAQVAGSVLACLDARAGDALDAGCEASLFANPENVAAASSYTAALFAFATDVQKIFGHRNSQFDRDFERVRRVLEQDRFGLLANYFAVQEGCSFDRCDLLVLLRDPTKVQANLEQRTFDSHVSRYTAAWGTQVARAPAAPAAGPPGFTIGTAPLPAPTGKPLPPDYVLPSAESIPAISIMNNEPSRESPRAGGPSDPGQNDNAAQPRRTQRAAQARSRSSTEASAPPVSAPLSLTQ